MRKSKVEALRSDMRHAVEVLGEQGYAIEQVSDYQLKIKDLSFYPRTGTIYRDGDKKAFKDKGLEAFINFLEGNPGFRPFRPAPRVKLEF